MLKQLKPGHYYIVINLDEPYAEDVYEVLKYGQMQKGEDVWPERGTNEYKSRTFKFIR